MTIGNMIALIHPTGIRPVDRDNRKPSRETSGVFFSRRFSGLDNRPRKEKTRKA